MINDISVAGQYLTQISHPNLPKYIISFIYNDNYYLISDYINSTTNLKSELKQKKLFQEKSVKPIIIQLISIIKFCLKNLTKLYINLSNLESITLINSNSDQEENIMIFVI